MQSQQSIHSLSRGKGAFGKDAEIRTHQALHDAKPSECPKGDRDNKSEVYFKNRLFLQSVIGEARPTDFLFIKKLLTNTPRGYIMKIPHEGILKPQLKFRGNYYE